MTVDKAEQDFREAEEEPGRDLKERKTELIAKCEKCKASMDTIEPFSGIWNRCPQPAKFPLWEVTASGRISKEYFDKFDRYVYEHAGYDFL